jgi:hypothetical protein
VARRLLEASGFEVSEASGVVPLLARLDPDETNGPPPDWLLVDESWLASAAHRRVGLAAALTAALPRDRILLVGGPNVRRATPLVGWRRIVKPLGRSELQGALVVESGGASWRNAEAEIPYSLSL